MKNKRSTIIQIALLVIVALFVGVWIVEIIGGGLPYIDRWTRFIVNQVEGTVVYDLFRFITNFGSRAFVEPFTFIMVAILLIVLRNWVPALFFGIGTLLAHKINVWIKHLVARERPSILVEANAEGFSFPSGHAMVTIVCYGLLAYFLAKTTVSSREKAIVYICFAILIFLIGISRFFINVHYLTDILAGFLFGYILLIGLIYLYEWVERRRTRSKG